MAYNISIISNILESVNFLSESAQCRIIKASLAFLYDKDYELDDVVESTAFKMLIPMLTEARDKSKVRSEKMRANGMKGGRKKTQSVVLQNNESKKTKLVSQESPLSSPSPSPSLSSPTPPSNTLSTIPPIIPQENSSSSSCVCTHAREEDFDLRVGVIATIERYAEQYRQEGMWADVAMQNHLRMEQVQEIFKTFLFDQKHNSTDYSNYSDFKRHFLNYIRLRASAIKAEQTQHREEPKKVISGQAIFDVYK